MKFYKDTDGMVYEYSELQVEQGIVKDGLTEMTQAEIDQFFNPTPTPNEAKQLRINEILKELDEFDRQSVRPLRAKLAGTATEFEDEKLLEIETNCETLRTELSGLQSV